MQVFFNFIYFIKQSKRRCACTGMFVVSGAPGVGHQGCQEEDGGQGLRPPHDARHLGNMENNTVTLISGHTLLRLDTFLE